MLSFLAGLGLSSAQVSAVVANDPKFFCAIAETTLAPIVIELTDLGLSHSEITRLALLARTQRFRCRSIISALLYYLPFFSSFDDLLRALKANSKLLTDNLKRAVKPNVAFLLECGVGDCDIAKLFNNAPRLLTCKRERVRTIMACADSLGVPRESRMFRHALQAVTFLTEEKITAKVDYLRNTLRWSDAEVGIALSKAPMLLTKSKDLLQNKSEFLISEVGLEPAYIAYRPMMLMYNLESRSRPRYYVVKFLKENGLLKCDRDYYYTVMIIEKVFVEKFIIPHKEAAPHLAEDYATACRGDVPDRFRFT